MRRWLMLHAGALGDCVLALHLAAAVRRRFERVSIDLVARSQVGALAATWGLIDRFYWPEQFGLGGLFGDGPLESSLSNRLKDYDGVISLLGGSETDFSGRLRRSCPGTVYFVDPAPESNRPDRPIVQQWLAKLAARGLVLESVGEPLFVPGADHRLAGRALLEQVTEKPLGRVVVCHPGSGGRAKCCPLEILERVMVELTSRGITGLWMIGPTELDWHGPQYQARLARSAPVLGDLSVIDAAKVLAGVDVFVGNDAGMTHLAAALGVVTVALFGPTSPAVWKPLGRCVEVFSFLETPAGELIEEITRAAG